jgi:hypothetical protein
VLNFSFATVDTKFRIKLRVMDIGSYLNLLSMLLLCLVRGL